MSLPPIDSKSNFSTQYNLVLRNVTRENVDIAAEAVYKADCEIANQPFSHKSLQKSQYKTSFQGGLNPDGPTDLSLKWYEKDEFIVPATREVVIKEVLSKMYDELESKGTEISEGERISCEMITHQL